MEETLAGYHVLQLKGNVIPRGLMPLERLFDKNDIPVKPSKMTFDEPVRDVNIGTEEDTNVVTLSKGFLKNTKVSISVCSNHIKTSLPGHTRI